MNVAYTTFWAVLGGTLGVATAITILAFIAWITGRIATALFVHPRATRERDDYREGE